MIEDEVHAGEVYKLKHKPDQIFIHIHATVLKDSPKGNCHVSVHSTRHIAPTIRALATHMKAPV